MPQTCQPLYDFSESRIMSLLSKLFGKAPDRTIEIASSGKTFAVGPGATILERALAQGIAYTPDCTRGTSSSSRTRIISGKVVAITPFGYTLTSEGLGAGKNLSSPELPKHDMVLNTRIGHSTHAGDIR